MAIRPKFEDCIGVINEELTKRKNKWTLTSLPSVSYEDIEQIIRLHIWKKWHQYNPEKPLDRWVGTIITNQLKNLVRNNYTNYARPCLRCKAAIDSDGCAIYGKQCDNCPWFAHWKKYKEPAIFVKLPVSMENHSNEVLNISNSQNYPLEDMEKLHIIMKKILKTVEWKVYKGLYIDGLSEVQIAKKIGFISNEKRGVPGYKQIFNIKKEIVKKARKYINVNGLD